ncbi:MAG: hypothetical protein HY314_12195 [Acidobacteria bacterium]|nr:hypothetical protein [Acidobacteriota bacterium]
MAGVPSLFSPAVVQFNDLLWGTTMFPFGGVMALLGLGWFVGKGAALTEVRRNSSAPVPDFWIFWIRWIIPAFILSVLVYGWWDFFHSK